MRIIIMALILCVSSVSAENYFAECTANCSPENSQLIIINHTNADYSVVKLQPEVIKINNYQFVYFNSQKPIINVYLLVDQQIYDLDLLTVEDHKDLQDKITQIRSTTIKDKNDSIVPPGGDSRQVTPELRLYNNLLKLKEELEIRVTNDKKDVQSSLKKDKLAEHRAQLYNQQLNTLSVPEGIKSELAAAVGRLKLEKIKLDQEYKKLVNEYEG